jgi:hypothetical protein
MTIDVQHADPVARRRVILWSVIVMGALGALALMSEQIVEGTGQWVLEDPGEGRLRLGIVLAVTVLLVTVPAIVIAFWALGLARRTLAAERFPPPGSRVWRDTRILTGHAALWRGRLLRYTSYILLIVVLAAFYQGAQIWRLLAS